MSTNKKRVHLTQQGIDDIKQELDKLKTKEPVAIERVARAREMGDLSENSEYHAAREELSFIQGRIEELEEILAHAKIIEDPRSNGKVALGCKVTVTSDNGSDATFTIVGEYEADPMKKKISHDSPLGKALMGKSTKEKVEYDAPVGKIVYTIKKVH